MPGWTATSAEIDGLRFRRPGPSPWISKDEVRTVLLEAEPVDGGDSDEITITLHGDRDVQTWLTGWDQLQGSQAAEEAELAYLRASARVNKTS